MRRLQMVLLKFGFVFSIGNNIIRKEDMKDYLKEVKVEAQSH